MDSCDSRATPLGPLMTLLRRLLRIYQYPAYLASWGIFVGVGILLNIACAPMLLARNRSRYGPAVRATIRRLFVAWCAWLHMSRLIYVRFHGFTSEAMAGPAIYIAN